MDFTDARQMIHLRHELRRLLVERRHDEAQAVLARLEALVAADADAEEASTLRPELARWRTSLDMVSSPI